MAFRPKYVTFDCYGTLTRFRMGDMAREMFADRIPAERMEQFVADFSAYRFDEVLGDWKPYEVVLKNALRRTCRKWKLAVSGSRGAAVLRRGADLGPARGRGRRGSRRSRSEIPLVILSNASDDQIQSNVAKLGAPFHRRLHGPAGTGLQAAPQGVRVHARLARLRPEDMLHVSSSLRYDLMSADDLGIVNKVFVNRGHGPAIRPIATPRSSDIGGLPGVVGL